MLYIIFIYILKNGLGLLNIKIASQANERYLIYYIIFCQYRKRVNQQNLHTFFFFLIFWRQI